MKYVVVVGDGMADYPLENLGGKTPLQATEKPHMDEMARRGKCGLLRTVPEGMEPGSDVANLAILGYDPRKYYTGRGPLEAASIGVELGPGDLAFRCNLVTEEHGVLTSSNADHITTEEAKLLIEVLRGAFGDYGEFYPGVSYRHLFVLRECREDKIVTTPPHDIVGEEIGRHMVGPDGPLARRLNELILSSKSFLERHEANLARAKAGKRPGNMVWLWGQGRRPRMESFQKRFGIAGSVISAVDLVKGIGILLGMEVPKVPGATGYYDTNYEGKADYALRALEERDFAYVHVEAPDEAGHAGDLERKIEAIEALDRRLLGRLLDGLGEEAAIALLPDHPTPINLRTHVTDPVPFALYVPGKGGDGIAFDESSARSGSLGLLEGGDLMRLLLEG
ncbi:MAG: cofactor-independent phosphoglycerate mutase [Euryarchaeota archaeon]|nr:cofactor-independent phosphoglycerate mutase [Euryarchaeota archaeon]